MTQDQQQTGGVETRLARHGKVSYMEIPAVDTERSAAFYEKVFGWEIRGDERHRSFTDASGEMIGAWSTESAVSAEPGVVPYIYVAGIDTTLPADGAGWRSRAGALCGRRLVGRDVP